MNMLLERENSQRPKESDVKRDVFFVAGISMKSWAEARGFNPDLVYQVLTGRRKCLRGQSHAIAKELGMK
ncbi:MULTISPECIES: DNA-binding protein [Polaromonas]|uniref:DNA-binding protein n=1 Tax=Polaromonas aquatica TaxID=332657 RepID=A0ABW1U129_9BURK